MVVAARCSTTVAPPPVVMGGEGGDRAGTELGDGGATPSIAGEGAIDPSGVPPMLRSGWEGG